MGVCPRWSIFKICKIVTVTLYLLVPGENELLDAHGVPGEAALSRLEAFLSVSQLGHHQLLLLGGNIGKIE